MGCISSKQSPSSEEVKDPTVDLIKTFFDFLSTSRNNLKCFEPTYYLLNEILQKSLQTNLVSKEISKALKDFQMSLPKILQDSLNDENFEKFFKSILPVQTSYNSFYHSSFDWQGKMKKVEGISLTHGRQGKMKKVEGISSPQQKENVLEEFFLNEPAEFWLKNFMEKKNTSFSDFLTRFIPDYMQIFDQDFNSLPEKKVDLNQFKENILLLLKYELESNNDLNVSRDGWNVFSFKTLFNYTARSQFIERACVVPKNKSNRLTLRFIYLNGEALEEQEQKEYHISQEGVDLNAGNPMRVKDMLKEKISVGRHVENDIRFDGENVSRKHFVISMKKALKGDQITNEYYVGNVSQSYTYFVVEAEGYLLAKNLIISLTQSKQFFIKDIYPPFSAKTGFLSVEPQFLEKREKKPIVNCIKPFIEIEFLDNQVKSIFEIPKEEEDFTITIGSGPDNSVKVNDKNEDGDEEIHVDHCYIKYDSKNKCWIIQDKTIDPENIFYKTSIKCENNGQYEGFEEMRGIKLMDKMKVLFGNCAILVEEKKD